MRRFAGERTPFGEMLLQKKLQQQHEMKRNNREDTIHSPTENGSTSGYSEFDGSFSNFSLPQLPPRGHSYSSPSSPAYPPDAVEKGFRREREDAQGHSHRGRLDASTASKPDLHASSSPSVFVLEPGQGKISATGASFGGGKSGKNSSLAAPSCSLSSKKKNPLSFRNGEMAKSSMSNAPASRSTTSTNHRGVEAYASSSEDMLSSGFPGSKENAEERDVHSNHSIKRHHPPRTEAMKRGEEKLLSGDGTRRKEQRSTANEVGGSKVDPSLPPRGRRQAEETEEWVISRAISAEERSRMGDFSSLEKREDERSMPTQEKNTNPSGKTRPVPYSISPDTPPQELLHIIKTLQQELDERTISVNAIQRNFERLASMYQTSQKEMEILREAHEQSLRAADAEDAAQKVLRALQMEMQQQLDAHQVLRATCAKEREEAHAREAQLQATLSRVQQQLKEREEEDLQQQKRWSEMEEKQEKSSAAQHHRMAMAIDAVRQKESVQRQEEAERWHTMRVRQREAERASHRAALEQLIHEAVLVWQQGQHTSAFLLSGDTRQDGSALEDDQFAQWMEKVGGKDWHLSGPGSLSSSSSSSSAASFFSFPPSWRGDERQDDAKRANGHTHHHSARGTSAMVSFHPLDMQEEDEQEKRDSLEYWVVPLKDLLKRIREGFRKAEQERQHEHAMDDSLLSPRGGVSRAFTAVEEEVKKRQSLERTLVLQQHQWRQWSFSLLVETEKTIRRGIETLCFHTYQKWCHQWAAASRTLWVSFSQGQLQKDHKITMLSEELKVLQKALEEGRERVQEHATVEIQRLQKKLASLEVTTHEYAQKMFVVERERDQAKKALHILTTDVANGKKKWRTEEAENRQKREAESAAVAETHAKALQRLREELEVEHATAKHQLSEEIQSLRGKIDKIQKNHLEELKEKVTGTQQLVQGVEQQKNVLFQTLLHSHVIEEERAARSGIAVDEHFHRQLHGRYYTSHWMAQLSRVCQKQLWELTTQETAARTALRIEEIASCTSMVFFISTATSSGEMEKQRKREREEVLYQLEALRQRLQHREKELLILHEHCAELTKSEQQHQQNLKEKDILQSKCDILEEEMEERKLQQVKEMQSLKKIQKAAFSSIQCLIAAEEASESTYSCPLCLELFRRPLACVPCGHTFCETCIRNHPKNVRLRKLSAHFDAPSSKTDLHSSTTSLGLYCPECRTHAVSSLLESKTLAALSSKFEYRKNILRDIVLAFRQSSFSQTPSSP